MAKTPIDWLGTQKGFDKRLRKERWWSALGAVAALFAIVLAVSVTVYGSSKKAAPRKAAAKSMEDIPVQGRRDIRAQLRTDGESHS